LPGPLLMLVLCWIIWLQLRQQVDFSLLRTQLSNALQEKGLYYIPLLVALMIVNWLIESIKWKLAVASVQQVSLFNAFKAVLSGVSISLSLPNRIGEYLGRVLYLDPARRIKAISVTVVASFSQLIVTMTMGLIGLLLARPVMLSRGGWALQTWWIAVMATAVVVALMLLLYFNIRVFHRWLQDKLNVTTSSWAVRFIKWVQALDSCNAAILRKLLSLSLLRYCVFMIQYFLAYQLFGILLEVDELFIIVSLTFLALAALPTFAAPELALRGAVGLWIANWFSLQSAGIVLALLLVWITNLILPALIGALLVLGIRNFFNLRHETA
ncbi:MAG: lysylphosphatidylglycerol synthase domain-containing protein, partial [Sphingomonadales bacterium]